MAYCMEIPISASSNKSNLIMCDAQVSIDCTENDAGLFCRVTHPTPVLRQYQNCVVRCIDDSLLKMKRKSYTMNFRPLLLLLLFPACVTLSRWFCWYTRTINEILNADNHTLSSVVGETISRAVLYRRFSSGYML